MTDLKGRVALITGGSSGIGAATARLLAGRGCAVAINFSRSREAAQKVAADCQARGGETLLVQGNVADDADCRRVVEETLARFGHLDYLVNNAGTTKFVAHRDLAGLSAQDFHDIFAVNTIAPFQMVRAAEPYLRATKGAVVNVSSIAGVYGTGSSIAYVASKAALNGMTLSLARVLGPEVRINAVCPGFVEGEWLQQGMGEAAYKAAQENWQRNAPLGTTNKPEDIAQSIAFFLTAAVNVTGETLLIDSGMRLAQPRPPYPPRT
ncbi:SDR family NAD(P)-dependent oxidoreductase [Ferrovibrio terrae]|uniref:SDR family NAD(P)-dependent oxidoreductase n=1 Tax=Ferrovibrio terrae TaxID=2594003 RepID=UPI0031378BB1